MNENLQGGSPIRLTLGTPDMHSRIINYLTGLLLLLGCQAQQQEPLPPDQYLDHALKWLEANAVTSPTVNWEAVRAEALALANEPQTTADTYPAIEYTIDQLNDPKAFMIIPEKGVFEGAGSGITAVYPQNIIVEVRENSPAAEAGIHVGDQVLAINGDSPKAVETHPHKVDFLYDPLGSQTITLSLQRDNEQWETTLTEAVYNFESQPVGQALTVENKTAAYLELPTDSGTRLYPTNAQAVIAAIDSIDTCGWIIDLRRTRGGDLWTYFAALSPILGDGELGGFVYNDGREEVWRLEDGKVFWAEEERQESYVRGRRYELKRPFPPVAILISPLTEAAGELVIVAFQGWGSVRTFGEPTLGAPHLILHAPLSDDARLFVSGARGMDRLGNVYNGAIIPNEAMPTAWQQIGTDNDPTIIAAQQWLAAQPLCIS
jgi:C-terminal processing protease CtpA/Prc